MSSGGSLYSSVLELEDDEKTGMFGGFLGGGDTHIHAWILAAVIFLIILVIACCACSSKVQGFIQGFQQGPPLRQLTGHGSSLYGVPVTPQHLQPTIREGVARLTTATIGGAIPSMSDINAEVRGTDYTPPPSLWADGSFTPNLPPPGLLQNLQPVVPRGSSARAMLNAGSTPIGPM